MNSKEIYFVKYATHEKVSNKLELFKLHLIDGSFLIYPIYVKTIHEKIYENTIPGFDHTLPFPIHQGKYRTIIKHFRYFKNKRLSCFGEEDIDNFTNCYIVTETENTSFGKEFGNIFSYDLIESFRFELDRNDGRNFQFKYPIYEFLRMKRYEINDEGYIQLRNKYSYYYVNKDNYCFKLSLDPYKDYTESNIKLLYDEFYKNLYHERRNHDISYSFSDNCIYCHGSRDISANKTKFFKSIIKGVGSNLTSEEINFLKNLKIKL